MQSMALRATPMMMMQVVQGGNRVSPEEMSNSIDRIKVLGAYLDEVRKTEISRDAF